MVHSLQLLDGAALTRAEINRYHEWFTALRAERFPEEPVEPIDSTIAVLENIPGSILDRTWVLTRNDGSWIAAAQTLVDRNSGNDHLLQTNIGVLPKYRRQRLAQRLLAHVLDLADAEGRSTLIGVTYDAVPAGGFFAGSIGGVVGSRSHINRLDLHSVDHDQVRAWIKSASGRTNDYELLRIDGGCPDDLVADLVDVMSAMDDAPTDDVTVEHRRRTVDNFRDKETMVLADGTRRWVLAARHKPSGTFAGFTEVRLSPRTPAVVQQEDTGVLPEHRGHGLGILLKATMLSRIITEATDRTAIHTANADSNAAMLAINQRLGFRPHRATSVWQVDVDAARASIGQRTG